MATKYISSLQHPIVKHLRHLRCQRKYRYQQQRIIIEGQKMISELAHKITIHTLCIEENIPIESPLPSNQIYRVKTNIIKKISGVNTPTGWIAEVSMPQYVSFQEQKRLIVLDGISDPGNLGTLLRTALALSWDGAIIFDNCVDPYNDKALRSAQGATLHLPLAKGSWKLMRYLISTYQYNCIFADTKGSTSQKIEPTKRLLLVLSSEAHGPSSPVRPLGQPITIPMNELSDSLNVAIAGAILMNTYKPHSH